MVDKPDMSYIQPVTMELAEQPVVKERPDAVFPTMGGQTALNQVFKIPPTGIGTMRPECMHIANRIRLNVDEMWTEANNVGIGVVQSVFQHGIHRLVMGSTVEKKDILELKPNKTMQACEEVSLSCQL